MTYWLMKSEPLTYGIQHLEAEPKQTDHWDGIRNYQVRNLMRDTMRVGDQAFFYHSNCKVPGIVGTVEIVREAYPDHTAQDPESPYYDPKSTADNPRWVMVDVKARKRMSKPVTLKTIKDTPALAEMKVAQRGQRLSIQPVTKDEFDYVVKLGKPAKL